MPTGPVIDNQRFGKVMKKAVRYPQIGHVNLETLSFLLLSAVLKLSLQKTKTKDYLRNFFSGTFKIF